MPFDFSKLTSPRPGPPIVIAEIGTAHGGDLKKGLELGLELIDAAADAGARIAKVQVVFAEEILPPEAGLVPLPGGDTPLYEVFEKLERPVEFYAALAERAASRNIGFLASPFGEKSIRLLEDIGVQAWKVASPELNFEPLLQRLAATGLPLILSTGVSKMEDIQRALEVIEKAAPGVRRQGKGLPQEPGTPAASDASLPITILHCLTSYPAPENQANLRVIPALAAAFGHPAGLSDHSLDPILVPSLAAALGAVVIEKHITLSREAGGLDDPVALIPEAFAEMTAAVKRFALPENSRQGEAGERPMISPGTRSAQGKPPTAPAGPGTAPDPTHLSAVINELAGEYGRKRVEACLGDGIKTLAPVEEGSYRRTNRSLHAVGPLKKGTVISEENTALLRTEKVLNPGLEPRHRGKAYGRRLLRDIPSGDGITLKDLQSPGVAGADQKE